MTVKPTPGFTRHLAGNPGEASTRGGRRDAMIEIVTVLALAAAAALLVAKDRQEGREPDVIPVPVEDERK